MFEEQDMCLYSSEMSNESEIGTVGEEISQKGYSQLKIHNYTSLSRSL